MLSGYHEESPLATEIRRTISKMKIVQRERGVKCIMMTSSTLGEGKSTTAACLAIASSLHRDTKTVMVDFDLRRPRQQELFQLKKKHGVADILSRKKSVKECLKATPYRNLQVITCGGNSHQNTSALLNSPAIVDFFSELRFYFDLVIVDAPPVIPVSDPLMLSSEIDGALFVIKAGKTQKPVIRRAVQLLKDAQIETFGVIVNNMDHVLPYYYEYDFYDYKYLKSDKEKKQSSDN